MPSLNDIIAMYLDQDGQGPAPYMSGTIPGAPDEATQAQWARDAAAARTKRGVKTKARDVDLDPAAPAVAEAASGLLPGAGIADMFGLAPTFKGDTRPSFGANVKAGRYRDAALQTVGATGDMMLATGALAPAGIALKAGRAALQAGRAAKPMTASKQAIQEAADAVDAARGIERAGKLPAEPAGSVGGSVPALENVTGAAIPPGMVSETAAARALEKRMGGPVTGLTGAGAPETTPIRGQTGKELVAMQRKGLSPEETEAFENLKAQYPEFAQASRFLMPNEIRTMLKPDQVEQMTRLLDVLPSSAHMSSLAKAGAPKLGWYRSSTQALIDVFGQQDAPRFAALLAATSPQNSVEMNLLNSLNIWRNWTAAGRPTDPRAIKAIMGQSVTGERGEESVLNAWVNNSMRALTSPNPLKATLSGSKVDSFMRNLADDVYRVTNDAWMANATGINQDILRRSPSPLQLEGGNPGYSPAYLALNSRVREGGNRIGMTPAETQETIWSVAMPLMEMQGRLGIPAREILQRGLLTPQAISGTPDYATLLKETPVYRQILEQSGYGPQMARLESHRPPPVNFEFSPADQRALEKTAETLEALRGQRTRESRSFVQGGMGADRGFAYQQAEGIPGRGTGHMEGLIDAPEGTRDAISSRILSPFRDPQGHDIVMRSLGLDTVASTPMSGSYRPDVPGPITGTARHPDRAQPPVESNMGVSSGAEIPLKADKAGKMQVPKAASAKLDFASALKAYMTGNNAAPWRMMIPDKEGTSLAIPLDKRASRETMKYMGGFGSDYGVTDTGRGVNVLNFGDPIEETRAQHFVDALGGKKAVNARAEGNYVDMGPKWREGEGSRAATGELMSYADKISARDLARVDTPELRQAAAELRDRYTSLTEGGKFGPGRKDLINALDIMAKSGIAGLKQAYGDVKSFLPALAALGVGPALLSSRSEEGL